MKIQIQHQNDQWWLTNVEGEAFVSIGVNHLQSDCWLAPYNLDYICNKYGDDLATADLHFNPDSKALRQLTQEVKSTLKSWGFNSFGLHTYDVPHHLLADEFYYCIAVEYHPLGSRFKFDQQTFPDIFSPEFERGLDAHIKSLAQTHKAHSRFIGYAFSDIPRWYFFEGQALDAQPVHPWVLDLANMPEDSPGHQAFQRFKDDAGIQEITTRDHSNRILSRVVEHWYALHTQLIQRHDPGRLILGDKLHSPHRIPEWLIPILKQYVDVVLIQWYLPIDQQRDTLIELHTLTGKPLLNGDSCFGCTKPPHQTQVKGYQVESQSAVGQSYFDYLKGLMELPFMLGWHHCGLMEQWDGGKRRDWEINENGFMDPFEKPYPEIIEPVTQANHLAHDWHQSSLK